VSVRAGHSTAARIAAQAARGTTDLLRRYGPRAVLHAALLLGAALMVTPFAWMLSASLKDAAQMFRFPPQWLPNPLVVGNYARVWSAVPLARFYLNSLFITTAITVGQLATAILAGYAFARLEFPGRDVLFLALLGTLMVPSQVTIIPTYIILRVFGWIDTYQGVIVPALVHPFSIFMLRQFFLSMPTDLEDAARIDGSSRLGTLFRIVLPLSAGPIAILGVFIFMWHWNAFLWPLIVLNSETRYTLPVGLAMLRTEMGTDWPGLMAATVMATLPVLILYVVAQKRFMYGLARIGLIDSG
jgi:multiple sugar transport system permease protein